MHVATGAREQRRAARVDGDVAGRRRRRQALEAALEHVGTGRWGRPTDDRAVPRVRGVQSRGDLAGARPPEVTMTVRSGCRHDRKVRRHGRAAPPGGPSEVQGGHALATTAPPDGLPPVRPRARRVAPGREVPRRRPRCPGRGSARWWPAGRAVEHRLAGPAEPRPGRHERRLRARVVAGGAFDRPRRGSSTAPSGPVGRVRGGVSRRAAAVEPEAADREIKRTAFARVGTRTASRRTCRTGQRRDHRSPLETCCHAPGVVVRAG